MSCAGGSECMLLRGVQGLELTDPWDSSFVRSFELHKAVVHLYLLHEENNDVYFTKSMENLEWVRSKPEYFAFYAQWFGRWSKAVLEKDVSQLVTLHLMDGYEGDELRKHSLAAGVLSQEERLEAIGRAR